MPVAILELPASTWSRCPAQRSFPYRSSRVRSAASLASCDRLARCQAPTQLNPPRFIRRIIWYRPLAANAANTVTPITRGSGAPPRTTRRKPTASAAIEGTTSNRTAMAMAHFDAVLSDTSVIHLPLAHELSLGREGDAVEAAGHWSFSVCARFAWHARCAAEPAEHCQMFAHGSVRPSPGPLGICQASAPRSGRGWEVATVAAGPA